MSETIEYCHKKIIGKINSLKMAISLYDKHSSILNDKFNGIFNRKNIESSIDNINRSYLLSTASIIIDYYSCNDAELHKTWTYYNIVSSENIIYDLMRVANHINSISNVCLNNLAAFDANDRVSIVDTLNKAAPLIMSVLQNDINIGIDRITYDICTCGNKYNYFPDIAELRCMECGSITHVLSILKKSEYSNNGEFIKAHSTYEPSRHYRFWMERIQALEKVDFNKTDLANISYVINRDKYITSKLTYEHMRKILKDPKVKATKLNDHIPLLVTIFGGRAPPRLDFQENYNVSIKFNKIMYLYDVHIARSGNKPYYPYFIYKIIEHEFRDNPEKRRLLNYIHLQSKETINKNDNYYKIICEHSKKDDDLVYIPTNISNKYMII